MTAFLRLLKKDLEGSKYPMLFNAAGAVLWLLFLRYRLESGWPFDVVAALAVLPLAFLPFWFVWQTYQSLRTEWKEDTIYTILTLPVPGWLINLSKMVALLIEYTIVTAAWVVGGMLNFWSALQPQLGELLQVVPLTWFIKNGLLIYLFSLAIFATFIALVQLGYIVGKIIGRLQGLILLWVLLLASWIMQVAGALLQPLFAWVPKIPLDRLFGFHEIPRFVVEPPQTLLWDISGSIGSWMAVIGLFYLGAWLLEHVIEVD